MATGLAAYESVRVLAVLKAQHAAMDRLMAALMVREEAMQKAGLLKKDEMFRPTTSGAVWEAVEAGHWTIQRIDGGCRVEA